jgi:muconolactone delta-isomerase
MLFIVISDPYFANNADVAPTRKKFKAWIDDLKAQKKVIQTYHKMGKGSVVIFDVTSNDELHNLLTQWLDIVSIPVKFEIIPLVTPK